MYPIKKLIQELKNSCRSYFDGKNSTVVLINGYRILMVPLAECVYYKKQKEIRKNI